MVMDEYMCHGCLINLRLEIYYVDYRTYYNRSREQGSSGSGGL
jgi:hypothetical protein